MASILLTAFEPFDEWATNASWLALVELTRMMPPNAQLTTRLYPVDFNRIRQVVAADLERRPDIAIHLGQAAGSSRVALEAVALNMRGRTVQGQSAEPSTAAEERDPRQSPIAPDGGGTLALDGPAAYRTQLPLASIASRLETAGIPTRVSHHAGTFLCNAAYFWSLHITAQQQLPTKSLFVHVPLAPEQVIASGRELPSMPSATVAAAIGLLAAELEAILPNHSA